jgi:type IV secretion system protein VirB10
MFGQGQVLIPQGATLVGAQQGQPKVGQERLDFLVQRGIFPDGTVLSFAGSRIGDATGATGIPGTVNNHYVKLGIATVLTAALSVGAREVGGTSTSFRSTPEEEFGRDIAGSVNTTGRDIIRRQLVQGPTITREPGAAVVIQLKETVSLQTPPQIVKQ